MVKNDNQSECLLTRKIVNEYYESIRLMFLFDEPRYMKEFKANHEREFSMLYRIHTKRTKVNDAVDAMSQLERPVYFGTLTFNQAKDKNKRSTKRREAFLKLGRIFRYVLLVEELGDLNGRYHIHFVGVFKDNYGFDDFKTMWHSRQNLKLVDDKRRVGQYMVKYMTKQVPRIRRNKAIIGLIEQYKKGRRLERAGFKHCGIGMKEKTQQFDLLLDDDV